MASPADLSTEALYQPPMTFMGLPYRTDATGAGAGVEVGIVSTWPAVSGESLDMPLAWAICSALTP